jgi:hypothetical protein
MNSVVVQTRQLFAFYCLLLLIGLQGCASSNPLAQAETVEQKAYAAYGSFVIAEEQAAKLVSSGQLTNNQIIAIGRADERAKAVVDDLIAAVLEFEEIQDEFKRFGTGEQRYINAMNSLNNWTERLVPLINNLLSAVQGAEQ